MKGILGKKIGMTQVFTADGILVPVTVIEVEPNVVTQIKTTEKDGYDAIQVATHTVKEKNATKASIGHTKKANTEPKRFLKEFRGVNVNDYTLGQVLDASVFKEGEIVDVTGISKGKGYQGVIKRYNQTRGPMGHGSQYHRGVGSLGTLLPMHVLKGKKLPGHMGNEQVTIQNLEVVKVIKEDNIILVKGNVPGPKKSLVIIKSGVKANGKSAKALELVSYEEMKDEVVTDATDEVVEEAVETPVEETVEETSETTEENSLESQE